MIVIIGKDIISRDNKRIKYAAKLLNSAKFRSENKQFVIEGIRLCEDALLSGVFIKQVFFTKKAKIKYSTIIDKIIDASENSNLVEDEILKLISDTQNPQGIVCICEMNNDCKEIARKHILALEDINDPSNMGTILRTAEAFGFDSIVISKNCCDIYNPKVLRGSMGAVFRIKFKTVISMPEFISTMNAKGVISCASLPSADSISIQELDFKSASYLMVIGNEAQGIREDTIKVCKKKVTIPMPGKSESLNAATAASILMWEMVR